MKILILTQWYPPEPQEFLSELAESLREFGHDVTVLTGFPNWPSGKLYPGYRIRLWQREHIRGIPIIRVPLYPDHSHSAFLRIINFLSFLMSAVVLGSWLIPRVDVIHVIHPPLTMGGAAWVLSRLHRIPFTYEIQDMWPETLRATGMLNNEQALALVGMFAKWVYRCTKIIRVISPGFKANLVNKGVHPDKIRVISNWVDTDFFRPFPPDFALAQQFGFNGVFNVVFTGTIGLAQGLETVLEAALLLRDLPEIQFVLIGDGADLEHLQGIATERQIANVRFLGRHPANLMPRFNALADVLFLHLRDDPLFRITIPHKIFTYLASGKAILGAVSGDAAEVISNAQAGVVCPPADPKALAEAVRMLYHLTPSERQTMGENGRRAAEELYGRAPLISQVEKMLKEAVYCC